MIDVETKLLEAFREQGVAQRQLRKLQEQMGALQEQMAPLIREQDKRTGYINAQLERYEDEKGEPFGEALKKDPGLKEKFERMQNGAPTPPPALAKVE